MGRNPLPVNEHRVTVNVTLSPAIVDLVNRECIMHNVSRSRFIETAVCEYMRMLQSRNHLEMRVKDVGGVIHGKRK